MARTAAKVRALLDEDPSIGEALANVIHVADQGDGEVEWADVRDDLTSGQWGRLIEKGILVDGLEGFEVADEATVREILEAEDVDLLAAAAPIKEEEDEEMVWTQWDKGAAVLTVGLFAGYAWGPARGLIGGTMDLLIGPINEALPFYGVVMVLALFTGLYSTLLQANLMDMEKMGEYQNRMKAIQEKRKRAKEKGDDEAIERIQQEQMEAMGDQLGMFKEQFRPMVWIMLFTIPVFLWMYWMLLDGDPQTLGTIVFPLAGELETWRSGVIGPIEAWIVWYFLCSMAFTQVIRKSLNIQMTPTSS